jgi:hypothetical protein
MNVYLQLYRGETRVIRLSVTDTDTGLAVDLTTGAWEIDAIEWQMKTQLGGADPGVLTKALGTGITIQSGAVADQIAITLDPADTSALALGGYMHDCVATFASGPRLYLIQPSGAQLLDVVNQL